MNAVDIAILVILSGSMLMGVYRGFIRELASLLSWLAALWLAYAYAMAGAVYFEAYIAQPPLRVAAAFISIFVLALIVFALVSALICKALSLGDIGGLDRSLGLLFGVARGVALVAMLALVAVFMDVATQPWWRESLLMDYFTPAVAALKSLLPPDLTIYFEPPAAPPEGFAN